MPKVRSRSTCSQQTNALRQAVEKRRSGRRDPAQPVPEVTPLAAPLETGSTSSSAGPSTNVVGHEDQTPMSGDMSFDNICNVTTNNSNFLEDSNTGLMLAAHVSLSIKEKIWANEFVELQSLLKKGPNEVGKQKFQLINGELVLSSGGNLPKLTEKIEPWSDAFIIFMSVYIEKHPAEARNLLQYFHNIRLASSKFSGWLNYDRQFRLKKSLYNSIAWQSVDPELWMMFMQPLQQNFVTQKPCYAFNQRGFCVDKTCMYTHFCQKCQGQHPAISCKNAYGVVPRIQRSHAQYSVKEHYLTPRYPANRFRAPFTRPAGSRTAYSQSLGTRQLPY